MATWEQRFRVSCRLSVALVISLGLISSGYADLVTHWKLDEGDGDVFEDAANGFDGFLPDGMTIEWDDGPPTQDNAVRFLGADSFIATEFPGIGGSEPRTVTFWLKTLSSDARMIGWGTKGVNGRKWHLRLNGASGVIRTEFAGGQNFATTPVNDGEWHHIASVFPEDATEGFEVIHYIDGVLDPQGGGKSIAIDTALGDGTGPWDDTGSSGNFYVHFGTVLAHGSNHMLDGSMADIRIYDEALSEDQVIDIMEGVDTGVADNCPIGMKTERDGANVKLTWRPQPGGTETSVRVVRNGTELAAAAPVDPPQYVDTTAAPGDVLYELTFNVADCRTSSRRFQGCISDLEASVSEDGVGLTWVNNFVYTNIVIHRGDEVIATIGGDEQSFVDADAPAGTWIYSVLPANGDCDPATADATVFASVYARMVVGDGALAYWRLGEDDGTVAVNAGSLGAALDGTYAGNIELGQESLLKAVPDDLAVGLDGIDAQVNIPDSSSTNAGGPFESKTIELWFQAELIDTEPRMLFEEGGTTNGFSMYVQEVDGDFLLFMVAWSANRNWDSVAVSAEIEKGVSYHAVMVFDASENDEFGDFDGRVTGYLDGEEFDTQIGADLMHNHDNNNAIGAVRGGETQLADSTDKRDGGFFWGIIDDVSLYDFPLDDLDDDWDFGDSRVLDHYMAGVGAGSTRPTFHRGDTDGDGTLAITDAVAMLGFLFSGGGDTTCKETQDFDNDGSVVITDAVAILGFLFSGGVAPAAPGPTSEPCGPDPDPEGSAGDLGCDAYTGC